MKINKHIEIVRSKSTRLSSLSQKSTDAILSVLSKYYREVGVTIVDNLADLESLILKKPDLVFLGAKFIKDGSSRVWLSAYLDECGIACTASAQSAFALEYDKAAAKQRVIDMGLVTSPFCVARRSDPSTVDNITLEFPLFVKPLSCGGGLGIDSHSVVRSSKELGVKIQTIADNLAADSLVEEYLPGREFTVAILQDEVGGGFSVMPMELIAPITNGISLLSKDVKSADAELAVPVTDFAVRQQVEQLALDVFYAIGARDFGRIDIRMDESGVPHFLEANLLPDLGEGFGSFPKACVMNAGLDHEAMILRIVRLALDREPVEPVGEVPALRPLEAAIATI